MSLTPDVSAIATAHVLGFRSGHAQARYHAQRLINEMIDDIVAKEHE